MHVFTLFPHIIVFVIMCANSCKCVSYPKACYLGEFFILVGVENWLGNARMYNGYMKNKYKEKKNESDSTLNFHY